MFGWSATSSATTDARTGSPAAPPLRRRDARDEPATASRSRFSRLLIEHLQAAGRDPFALAAIEFSARAVASGGDFMVLSAVVRGALLDRLRSRFDPDWLDDEIDEATVGLFLPGIDTQAGADSLRNLLQEGCRHALLADRRCYDLRWRLGIALYPGDGHAPARLLRQAQTRLRGMAWQ